MNGQRKKYLVFISPHRVRFFLALVSGCLFFLEMAVAAADDVFVDPPALPKTPALTVQEPLGSSLPAEFTPPPKKAELPAPVTVMFFNLRNYFYHMRGQKNKSSESRHAVSTVIAEASPDILLLCEMGRDGALNELRKDLAAKGLKYAFWSLLTSTDTTRHLAILSRFQPVAVMHDAWSSYPIKDQPAVRVRRGFIYCIFRFPGGYVLHVLAAHLKSRVFHPLGQSDMRRYEARLLRRHATQIMRVHPQANILVMGDMNDIPGSSTILSIMNNRFKPIRRLYDLRPTDSRMESWTHWWIAADEYSRLDYVFGSMGILPEIDFSGTRVLDAKDWVRASDHRALITRLIPKDRQKMQVLKGFVHSIRVGPRPFPLPPQPQPSRSRKTRKKK